jgi:SAM-dependent methyltransferase
MNLNNNTRVELISLLRGYAACPILSGLGELGFLDRMLAGPFNIADFPEVGSPALFGSLITYLTSLGLIAKEEGQDAFNVSPLGRSVFARFGSFSLIHSYRDYFEQLPGMLIGRSNTIPHVDRDQNVLGSGLLHAKKFFPVAYDMLSASRIKRLIDIGCGNGEFLSGIVARHKHVQIFALDLSKVAVAAMLQRIRAKAPSVYGLVANGRDVKAWSARIPPCRGKTVISMLYVVHEFTKGCTHEATAFFNELYTAFPKAEVLLGEIVLIRPETLSLNRCVSIMPEFLLFHALSGQGVLSWQQHRKILRSIPYQLRYEKRFDEVLSARGHSIPSSFIWLLTPKVS